MAKSKPFPAATTSKSPQTRRYWPLYLLAFLIVSGVGLFYGLQFRNERALAADEARFVQAEREVEQLSQRIITVAGKPLEAKSHNYCSRPSVKYGEGELSCNITKDLFYGVDNEIQATKIYTDVSSEARKVWELSGSSQSNNMAGLKSFNLVNMTDYSVDRDEQQIFEVYKDDSGRVGCRQSYTLYKSISPPYESYPSIENTPLTLSVRSSCGDSAKIAYYPETE